MTRLLFLIGPLCLLFGATLLIAQSNAESFSDKLHHLLFAVITKIAITSAIGNLISQSKWLWYRQDEPHSLKDLQLFEDASRGPWGAVALLFSIRARSVNAPILLFLSAA